MDSLLRPFGLVLLVDDGELDNFLHQKVIERTRFAKTVVVKNSARGALAYLREHEHEKELLPDLIFLDINMPGMDGFQFLKEFNSLSAKIKNNCIVIVLSSSINKGEVERITRDQHVLMFIDKPLRAYDLEKLQSTLSNK